MVMKFDFSDRLARLYDKISVEEVEAFLITKPVNVNYFSNFRGDSTALLIGKNFRQLVTDGRYLEQANRQAKNFAVVEQTEGLYKKLVDVIKNTGCKKIGVEGLVMTVAQHAYLAKEIPGVEFKSVELDTLRQSWNILCANSARKKLLSRRLLLPVNAALFRTARRPIKKSARANW